MINIIDKRAKNIIDAYELNAGDVFLRQGSYYLRIGVISTENAEYFNAINLETMDYAEVSDNESVIRVTAELVIRG